MAQLIEHWSLDQGSVPGRPNCETSFSKLFVSPCCFCLDKGRAIQRSYILQFILGRDVKDPRLPLRQRVVKIREVAFIKPFLGKKG